jgi:hypothetical protein
VDDVREGGWCSEDRTLRREVLHVHTDREWTKGTCLRWIDPVNMDSRGTLESNQEGHDDREEQARLLCSMCLGLRQNDSLAPSS